MCNNAYKYQSFCTHRPQTSRWAWLEVLWRLAWLALDQAGKCLRAQRRPGHHHVWVVSSRSFRVAELRHARVHVCFGLLLITVQQGGKACVSAATSSLKTHSCASDLLGCLAGDSTHCSLVWLPSGRTSALRTGDRSPGTPAHKRTNYRVQTGEKCGKKLKPGSVWTLQYNKNILFS